jgi:hypothetical protein
MSIKLSTGDTRQRRSCRFEGHRARPQLPRQGGQPVGDDERDQLNSQGKPKLTPSRFITFDQ